MKKQWSLGAKLTLVGTPFLLLALLSTMVTLWVSWQLDGGAAAVNEAGRMRMQSYRMALSITQGDTVALTDQLKEFETSLGTLRQGDPERPLFVPWDPTVRASFLAVESRWLNFQTRWLSDRAPKSADLRADTLELASNVNVLVSGIEAHMARWTTLLHLLQLTMLAMAILAAVVLLYTGFLFVVEPVAQLKQAIGKIQHGDWSARVEKSTSDEFGTLADGFNGMAEHLQSMYQHLESKVAEKTAEIEEKRERLEGLYEVTALVANATTLDDLAQGFVKSMTRISRADGAVVRWSDQANQRYVMVAAHGLPPSMIDAELCIDKGDCHCGSVAPDVGFRVIPIQVAGPLQLQHCAKAGFETVVNIPIRLHDRQMGEVDLFFNARVTPTTVQRSLLEALTSHLASGMENLRLNSLEKEAAVSQERHLLARELHDSIAQSLAFLKIQVQLMRNALKADNAIEVQQVLEEIDMGVKESYSDVRELLLHFRTRTNAEDIEPALATTLRKFEHQSGVATALSMQGQGMPLSPDLQIQVLHIVQEALSNVRKHARASKVWLEVKQQPQWSFEVRDNGIGFRPHCEERGETHVGLRIMTERAQRIGAQLEVESTLGNGSSVTLTLLPPAAVTPDPITTPVNAVALPA
ncbi:MAG: type IV pili methyl-accepting chemotaxis transducer N-terminal domain-containing protein [Rhodoferax sp.]|nr:type IV pili methyl-accepting chemotaxis transducer N-terminal domain-containing protein [Rhodoferax sp.]